VRRCRIGATAHQQQQDKEEAEARRQPGEWEPADHRVSSPLLESPIVLQKPRVPQGLPV
jgi:hypothetical protein